MSGGETSQRDSSQSEVRTLLAEASSEDSDLEQETSGLPVTPQLDPTSQSTVSSTVSGSYAYIPPASDPAAAGKPTNDQSGISNRQTLCILLLSHSLVFILGIFIGGRVLLNRRIFS